MSGNTFKSEQSKNKESIDITLLVSYLEISGNSFKEEHLKNKPIIE